MAESGIFEDPPLPTNRVDPRCSRVVALVDMDCFYVEVERRYNQNLVGVPVAVRQLPIKVSLR